jgi:hypothetical protein
MTEMNLFRSLIQKQIEIFSPLSGIELPTCSHDLHANLWAYTGWNTGTQQKKSFSNPIFSHDDCFCFYTLINLSIDTSIQTKKGIILNTTSLRKSLFIVAVKFSKETYEMRKRKEK